MLCDLGLCKWLDDKFFFKKNVFDLKRNIISEKWHDLNAKELEKKT